MLIPAANFSHIVEPRQKPCCDPLSRFDILPARRAIANNQRRIFLFRLVWLNSDLTPASRVPDKAASWWFNGKKAFLILPGRDKRQRCRCAIRS